MITYNRYLILLMLFLPSAYASEYEADIQFAHRVTLGVPVSGEIIEVNVKAGQNINSGDILLKLNKIPFEASMIQAQANVMKHDALEKETRRDLEQLSELYDRGVLSKVDLENGQLKLQRIEAERNVARSLLTKARYDLEHTLIVAPFNGWVLNVKVSNHETVNNVINAVPLITVVEQNKYLARAYAPLNTVNKLKLGKKSKVKIGNLSFSGFVSSVALEPDKKYNGNKLYKVTVEFDSKAHLIRAGQTGQVFF